MSLAVIVVLAVLAALGFGIAAWLGIRQRSQSSRLAIAGQTAEGLTVQAREESNKILQNAQEEALRLRNTAESEIKEQRRELNRLEDRHLQREEQLERKIEAQEQRQTQLAEKESDLEYARKEVEEQKAEQTKTLERIAGLTIDEAREAVSSSVARKMHSTTWLADSMSWSGTTRKGRMKTPERLLPLP